MFPLARRCTALETDFYAVRDLWLARPTFCVFLEYIERFDQFLLPGEEEAQDVYTLWGLPPPVPEDTIIHVRSC